MSKKDDEITETKTDSGELSLPEPTPARDTSVDKPAGAPQPRAARFGEGAEGRGARRERGLSGPRTGFFERTGQFLRDVRAEMKRVSWPSATDVKNTTIITIVAVIFFAAYLFCVDRVLAFLITQLEHLISWIFGGA
ncbi:MAG: preprotein translocase subunit SecE [Pyrinomonadaceae bacterium]